MIHKKEVSLREGQLVMLDILIEFDRVCRENNLRYFLDWGTLLGAIRHKGFIPWDDDVDVSMPREDFERLKSLYNKFNEDYFLQTPETDKYYKYYYIPMKIRYNNSRYVEVVETGDEKFNNGIYIDVFPLDKLPKGKINYKLQNIYKYIVERSAIVDEKYKDLSTKRKLIYPLVYLFTNILGIKGRKKVENFFIYKCRSYDNLYWGGIDLCFKHIYKKEDIFPLREIEFEGKKFMAPNNPESILTDMYGDYLSLPPENERFSHSNKIEVFYNTKEGLELRDV
ncbi:MAG: LicD family protein [Clostridium sp.]|uniref:LicD family protein n=1 Tax=Clostridium sp. TaxID=1506 RepID=UPI00290CDC67|nr:LicD family protein [Clostridium sp.]MDU5109157.1 LicD family protein [Clostridium sp.]